MNVHEKHEFKICLLTYKPGDVTNLVTFAKISMMVQPLWMLFILPLILPFTNVDIFETIKDTKKQQETVNSALPSFLVLSFQN